MLERAQALWEPSHYHFELYKSFEKLALDKLKMLQGIMEAFPKQQQNNQRTHFFILKRKSEYCRKVMDGYTNGASEIKYFPYYIACEKKGAKKSSTPEYR